MIYNFCTLKEPHPVTLHKSVEWKVIGKILYVSVSIVNYITLTTIGIGISYSVLPLNAAASYR